ncbi:right-handed parallel beta-helix repeat-containing protein [bacterium]|nr:right-handed parallel beta-helix repeat-containing protein [bacterium]
MENTAITGNSTSRRGGGIYLYYDAPTLRHCIITNNSARYGASIYIRYSSPEITDSTIAENSDSVCGGGICGIYRYRSSPIISNNTIAHNSASRRGGGMYCGYGSSPTVFDSILWGDLPQDVYLYRVTRE